MAESGIDRRGMRQARALGADVGQRLPRWAFRALAKAMFDEGRGFKRRFRDSLSGAFKTGGRRVGNSFKVFTAGDDLDSLRLGVFTRWRAAELYEQGGTIAPRRGQWLAFPVTPRAFTAGGRIKRSWRTPEGRFKPQLFRGLRAVPLRGGRQLLLVRDRGVSPSGRLGRPTIARGVEAVEPVFLLIRRTRRRGVLEFFGKFDREAGARGERLQAGLARALRAIARRDARRSDETG